MPRSTSPKNNSQKAERHQSARSKNTHLKSTTDLQLHLMMEDLQALSMTCPSLSPRANGTDAAAVHFKPKDPSDEVQPGDGGNRERQTPYVVRPAFAINSKAR